MNNFGVRSDLRGIQGKGGHHEDVSKCHNRIKGLVDLLFQQFCHGLHREGLARGVHNQPFLLRTPLEIGPMPSSKITIKAFLRSPGICVIALALCPRCYPPPSEEVQVHCKACVKLCQDLELGILQWNGSPTG